MCVTSSCNSLGDLRRERDHVFYSPSYTREITPYAKLDGGRGTWEKTNEKMKES